MNKNNTWGGGGVTYIKGFTLIELLAVIVILAIIALIATPIVLDIIDSTKKSSVEATMKNIEKAALLEYSDLALTNEEKEEIIYNCYDGKCTYNGKTLNVKGDMPDRGRIIVNEDGATFENIIIKGYNCIKENNKFTCNNTGLTKVNGTSILIDNNETTEIENYRIYGNSIQNGEPTPDTPVDIESVGDLVTLDNCSSYGSDACNNIGKYVIPIKVTGKNLFDISKINSNINIIKNQDGTLTIKAYGSGTSLTLLDLSPNLKVGDRISFSIETTGYKGILIRNNSVDTYLHNNEKVYTINQDMLDGKVWLYNKKNGDTFEEAVISSIQIEYGDKTTEYEPYKETITNIYLDEQLRKVGEYSDYIDFKTGKVVRNVGTMEHTSNLESTRFTDVTESGVYRNYIWPDSIRQMKQGINLDGLCTTLSTNKKQWHELTAPSVRFGQVNTVIYIMTPTQMTTDQDLYNYVTNNGKNKSIYYYQLENPIEQSIDLPELLINKDTSVISVNTSVIPSNIELEYYR